MCAFTMIVYFVAVVRYGNFSRATVVPRERVFREFWKVVFRRIVIWLLICCVGNK